MLCAVSALSLCGCSGDLYEEDNIAEEASSDSAQTTEILSLDLALILSPIGKTAFLRIISMVTGSLFPTVRYLRYMLLTSATDMMFIPLPLS